MYEYKMNDGSNKVLKFVTENGVFYPTQTSTLLIESCQKYLRQPAKTLDLGSGIGLTGLVIAKLGLCTEPLYASDISKKAVGLTEINASTLGIKTIVRTGSLFEPWAEEKFSVIVDDVSGISDEVAKISPWFPPGVNCDAGRDGARWTVQVLESAPKYLSPDGVIFFPILSLSNENRILEAAKNSFSNVELLNEKEWFLPQQIVNNINILEPLIEEKIIFCKRKFGAWLWSTKIFVAFNKDKRKV